MATPLSRPLAALLLKIDCVCKFVPSNNHLIPKNSPTFETLKNVMKQLRILLLEDDQHNVELLDSLLSTQFSSYVLKWVSTKADYIQVLTNGRWDVIISNHNMLNFRPMETFKILQECQRSIPFILITESISEEYAVSCLKEGINDYLLKDNLSRLPASITHAIEQHELHQDRIKAELELQLKNEKLETINQELEKKNQELDSFMYSLSHNLRAPLLSILGLMKLMKNESEDLSEQFRKYFNLMHLSVEKLDDTLKEILNYTKNLRKKIEYKKVSIRKVIDECLFQLQFLTEFNTLQIKIDIEEDKFPLVSDETRLIMILQNLISNAIKYKDPNKSKQILSIKASVTSRKAIIKIKDNGIGIESRYLSRIFDMFFRGTITSQGTGLGLSIVNETIKKLQGDLVVNSKEGVGTSFKIEIPNHLELSDSSKVNPTKRIHSISES